MIETVITVYVAKRIVTGLCSNFMEVFFEKSFNDGKKLLVNNRIDKEIIKLAEFFTEFEADKAEPFLTDLQAAFSKENLKDILKDIRKEDSFDLETALNERLTGLCQEYCIIDDCDRIIDSIIELFFQLTVKEAPDLANRLFYNRLYNQNIKMMGKLDTLDERTRQILDNQKSYEMLTIRSPSNSSSFNTGTVVGSDEDMFEWELNNQHRTGLFGSHQDRNKEVLSLISHWRDERIKYPGWFIAPVGKRETVSFYTKDGSLLWDTDGLSEQEQLDFSYELAWRYETGLKIFDQTLQKNLYKIWEKYLDEDNFTNQLNNEKWFYIGQTLLRDFREDMNWDKWSKVYKTLQERNEFICNGEYELNWEFIKQLFFKMQITDVRDKLQELKFPKKLYVIRLQKYGLMAECGLISEAHENTKKLIDDLTEAYYSLDEENTKEKVYIGSIISAAYLLLSLIIQGSHPFERSEELKESWEKQTIFEKYYDFEHEKYQWNNNLYNYFCKHNEIPFELGRTIRTKSWGSNGSEKVYSFYRVLDRMGIPLSLGMTRLLSHQEIEFTEVLLTIVPLLGCYMLLRTGNGKSVKSNITRKLCIELGFDHCRNIFDYVYYSIENNLESMCVNHKKGNAYAHLLNNGLEILRRLVSVASVTQQKKLLILMCKLIDTDVMQEFNVMDRWISQILAVVDERIKAQFLNEILMSSTKNRSHYSNETPIDPFEVISSSLSAKKYYERGTIEPSIINDLINRANASEEDRLVVIPRLEKLYQWKQLSVKQKQQFCTMIWSKVDDKTGLPDCTQYYGAAFLGWPSPEGIDINKLVRDYIMNPDWYEKLKLSNLSAISMGKERIYDEIQCLNSLYPEFLPLKDKEQLLKYFSEYWEYGKDMFEKNENRQFYQEEFIDRYQSLERVISSFVIDELNEPLKHHLMEDLNEMKLYDINVLAAKAAICTDIIETTELTEEVIDALYSNEKDVIIDATNASEIIISKWPKSKESEKLLSELIRLIRYGRQPGLKYYFITIHNLVYMEKTTFSKEAMVMLNKALIECSEYTSYDKISDKSEETILDMIRLRKACAITANKLYQNVDNTTDKLCRIGIDKWKEICTEESSENEFLEVKRCWLQ